jgi:hypothetical protein
MLRLAVEAVVVPQDLYRDEAEAGVASLLRLAKFSSSSSNWTSQENGLKV